jgi:hypothetical protein
MAASFNDPAHGQMWRGCRGWLSASAMTRPGLRIAWHHSGSWQFKRGRLGEGSYQCHFWVPTAGLASALPSRVLNTQGSSPKAAYSSLSSLGLALRIWREMHTTPCPAGLPWLSSSLPFLGTTPTVDLMQGARGLGLLPPSPPAPELFLPCCSLQWARTIGLAGLCVHFLFSQQPCPHFTDDKPRQRPEMPACPGCPDDSLLPWRVTHKTPQDGPGM